MPIKGTVNLLHPSRNPHESNTHQRCANTYKWDSSTRRPPEAGAEPRPPQSGALDREGSEGADASSEGTGALRPSGCDDDPFGIPARSAGVGVGGTPLGSGGFKRGTASGEPDQEGNSERPSLAGSGNPGAPQAGTRGTNRRGVCVCERARGTDHGGGVSEALGAGGGGIDGGLSGPSPHAPAWVRLQAGERRPRHTGDTTLSGTQEYPAYRPLYRTVGGAFQGVLGGLKGLDGSGNNGRSGYRSPCGGFSEASKGLAAERKIRPPVNLPMTTV